MEFNRNQFFFLGLVILLLGLQFRMVESFELTPAASRFLAEKTGKVNVASTQNPSPDFGATAPLVGTQVVRPPEWLGWCLMSVGAVLILHSLAMPKPG